MPTHAFRNRFAFLAALAAGCVLAGLAVVLLPVATAAGVAVAALFALTYWRPFIGLAVVVVTTFVSTGNVVFETPYRTIWERYPIVFVPVIICLAAILLRTVVHPEKSSHDSPPFSGINAVLCLFLLWCGVSFMWTLDPYHGINRCFNLTIGLFIFFLCIHILRSRRDIERLCFVLAPWSIVMAAATFVSNKFDWTRVQFDITRSLYLEFHINTNGNRPGGLAPPQIAGTFLALAFFMTVFALWPRVKARYRPLLVLLGIFLISNILATGSKGAAGAFLLAGMGFLVCYPPIRRKFYLTVPGFMASVVMILLLNALFLGSDRLTKGSNVQALSISYRLTFWETGFEMLWQRWFGAGAGGFAHLVNPWPGAHSMYFAVLFDLGLVGAILFGLVGIAFALRLAYEMWAAVNPDTRRYLYCIAFALLSLSIHATVDIAYDLGLVWLILGVAAALINISRTERAAAPAALTPTPEPHSFMARLQEVIHA